MKDRQPTQVLANGAIRYGVYNADGTLDHYEYLKREDAPTVEGTPLNKANLLSDATAQKIWPNEETRPEDPTVSEALIELRKGASKIGDILMTARAKPSDAWLPCDGQSISQTEYPELFALLRSKAGPGDWMTKDVTGIDRATISVKHVNSKWFAFAYQRTSGSAYYESGTLYVYVSEDTNTWACYSFDVDVPVSSSRITRLVRTAICYSEADNAYYLVAVWSAASSQTSSTEYAYAYRMQPNFSTLQKKSEFASFTTGQYPNVLKLYATASGTLYCVATVWSTTRPLNDGYTYTASSKLYTSSDHAATWTTTSSAPDGIDYDPISDKFLHMSGRNVYIQSTLPTSDDAVLIGSVPTSIISEEEQTNHGFVPCVCAATNTIVIIWGSGRLYYAYSTDRGATWNAGTEPFSNTAPNGPYVFDNNLEPELGHQFVNGLLIFNAQIKNYNTNEKEDTICSLSDPTDKVYKTAGNTFTGALSEDGIAMEAPNVRTQADGSSGGYVTIRDYGTLEKDVPTIQPDTRSHAYIKALEE